jgi:hypothetical protein
MFDRAIQYFESINTLIEHINKFIEVLVTSR